MRAGTVGDVSDPDAQIDLYRSKGRSLGLVVMGLAFAAVSAVYLKVETRPFPGWFTYLMYGGLLLGLSGIVTGFIELTRKGPVVSMGPRGIFDRRLSTDWIPWSAIGSVGSATIMRNSFLLVRTRPEDDAGLPLRRGARRTRRMNAGIGLDGYGIAATSLVGGFAALQAAFHASSPRHSA